MVVLCYDGIRESISSALRAVDPGDIRMLGFCLVGLGLAWMCSVSRIYMGGAGVLFCYVVLLCSLFDEWFRSLVPAALLVRSVDRRRGAALAGMMFTGLVVGMVMYQYSSHRCVQLCKERYEVSSRRYVPDCCDSVSLHSFFICLSLSFVGAWAGAIGTVLVPSMDWDQVYLALSPTPYYMDPAMIRYSEEQVLSRTKDREVIQARKVSYVIRAVFHDGLLFALDNYTLYAAKFNKVDEVLVHVVDKPRAFGQLFNTRRAILLSGFRLRSSTRRIQSSPACSSRSPGGCSRRLGAP